MPAVGAEVGINGNRMVTVRAFRQGLLRRFACPGKTPGKHGRHHKPHAHSDTRPRLALSFSRLFHGHGCLHLHKLVHIMDNIHAALVINGLLHLLGRGNGGDIELTEL